MPKQELLRHVKNVHKVGDFTLTSGTKSDFYIDIKSLMFDAQKLTLMSYIMYGMIYNTWGEKAVAVGGRELGSVPLSTALAITGVKSSRYVYDHFVVRKNARDHGTKSPIEGLDIIKGKSVVLVDDVLTTGGSLLQTFEVLKENDVTVLGAVVVVDRQEKDQIVLPFPVFSIFTKREIIG